MCCILSITTCFFSKLNTVMASVPILDFWGPYAERGVGGGVCVLAFVVEMKEWMQCICLCFTLSRIALASLPRLRTLSTRFFFFDQETLWYSPYMIWLIFTWRGWLLWPNSKTKLKWKHLWEQGCFGRPTLLADSAYRADRLCMAVQQVGDNLAE